jgi:hypothetical protein
MYTGSLDSSLYPFAGEMPKKSSRRVGDELMRGAASQQRPGAKINTDFSNNPRLFTFVMGGLSHHEIVGISNLQNEISAQIVPGSNEIYSSS